MPITGLQLIIVTGKFLDLDGTSASGSIEFVASNVLVNDAANEIIFPSTFTIDLVDGAFSVALPATDDPDISPTGWFYVVTERITGSNVPRRTYNIQVPFNGVGGTINLADIVPVVSPDAVTQYSLVTHDHNDIYVPAVGLTENVQDIVGGMVTGNTETDIAVTYDDTSGKLNFEVTGGAGGGVPAITVPFFDSVVIDGGTSPSNIYHGAFWPTGVDLGPFMWRCWLRHDTGAEYWISEGFGGAHAILAGFGGSGGPTGNVWSGTTNTSFSGAYTAQNGEWMLYDVAWDGTNIWVLINGMVVGKVAFAGPRRAQYGDVFIGGSDHSNFKGCIAQVAAWEGQIPYASLYYGFQYPADRYFSDRISTYSIVTNFNANYLVPGADTYPDFSDGFNGQHHPGASRGLYNGFGVESNTAHHPLRIVDPTAPFGNQHDVARTRTFAAPVSVPVGAKIWDSFGRADTIAAFNTPTMGSTEGGSLGVKVWAHAALQCGIFDATAYCGVENHFSRVASDSADQDVRVGRILASGLSYACSAARINAGRTSGWSARSDFDYLGDPIVYLTRPDTSVAGTYAAPGSWTHLRLLTAGTTITVYTGSSTTGPWTQIGQVTGETANQAEVGVGTYHYYGIGTAGRHTDFHVAA